MRILITLLLLAGAHFALTATMPAPTGKDWVFWPFAADSHAVLGLAGEGVSNLTKLLSVIAGVCFLAALLALFGLLIPAEWWGVLVGIASVASLALYLLYLGPWLVLPIAIDIFLLWGIFVVRWSAVGLRGM
ncbi:MAG: hypothetical protein IPM53_29205 [Anaerolineaceae bacterium]|nr:hypothetical protein [Anaerolineaceae bacterium]